MDFVFEVIDTAKFVFAQTPCFNPRVSKSNFGVFKNPRHAPEFIPRVLDKTGKKIHLSLERYKHIQKHPDMHDSLEKIKLVIQIPLTIRYNEDDEKVAYFYVGNFENHTL